MTRQSSPPWTGWSSTEASPVGAGTASTRSTPGAWWRRCSDSTPAATSTLSCTLTPSSGPRSRTPTGKWLSLDARFLKQQQRSIGWIYAAALRSELSARLGVSWGPVGEGHADMEEVPAELLTLFSQRNAQVDARLAEAVAAWVDDHDGAEPDPRTLYRLERNAVLDSRPEKAEPIPAGELRGEWRARAQAAGFDPLAVPAGTRRLRASIRDDEVIGQALEAVAASSSSWLRADLAREISARLPAGVADSATEVVRLIDELAERACTQCVELHPPPRRGAACRGDGRPVTEHVVDRLLSTAAVLDQEARLLRWARPTSPLDRQRRTSRRTGGRRPGRRRLPASGAGRRPGGHRQDHRAG